jgi:hypothetical protein
MAFAYADQKPVITSVDNQKTIVVDFFKDNLSVYNVSDQRV